MPGSKWSFLITDLTGVKLGSIQNAYERKYTANLSKPSTAAFQVRQDNEIVPYLFDSDEDYLLQVWQGTTLRMWGPIISANLAMTEGQPPSIAVTAADPAWRMGNRYSWGAGAGFVQGPGDKAIQARELIGFQNSREGTNNVKTGTGIAGSSDVSGSTGSYSIQTGKSGLQGIQELSQGFDGFDWYIEPQTKPTYISPESANLYVPYIGVFRAASVVGEAKSVRFEYGTGSRNVRAINYLRDQTGRANLAINISEEGLEATANNPKPIVSFGSVESFSRYGLYEQMAELSGVNNVAFREQYVKENVEVRKEPRRVLAMTSDIDDGTGRVPQFGVDYWLGDTVNAKAVLSNNFTVFDGITRVYSVEVTLNNAGTGIVTPILLEESNG